MAARELVPFPPQHLAVTPPILPPTVQADLSWQIAQIERNRQIAGVAVDMMSETVQYAFLRLTSTLSMVNMLRLSLGSLPSETDLLLDQMFAQYIQSIAAVTSLANAKLLRAVAELPTPSLERSFLDDIVNWLLAP